MESRVLERAFQRKLVCSCIPSASPYYEPVLRPKNTPMEAPTFGFVGLWPLDSDCSSAT